MYNYSKTSGSLWKYYRDEPNDTLTDFESFQSKVKKSIQTPITGNTNDDEIAVALKYLSSF